MQNIRFLLFFAVLVIWGQFSPWRSQTLLSFLDETVKKWNHASSPVIIFWKPLSRYSKSCLEISTLFRLFSSVITWGTHLAHTFLTEISLCKMVSILPVEMEMASWMLSMLIWGSLFMRSSMILIFEGVTASRGCPEQGASSMLDCPASNASIQR